MFVASNQVFFNTGLGTHPAVSVVPKPGLKDSLKHIQLCLQRLNWVVFDNSLGRVCSTHTWSFVTDSSGKP